MPDQKISQLASGTNAQAGDLFVIARSGANYSLTTAQLFAPLQSANSATGLFLVNSDTGSSATARVTFSTQGGNAYIEARRNASGSLVFNIGAADRWVMNNSGHFLASADNVSDIGASGANRPRDLWIGRNAYVAGDSFVATTSGGAAGLSVSSDKNLSFSETAGISFANLFRQSNSAGTVVANGYKYTSTANGFASSANISWARSAIRLAAGGIQFYADPASTVANGTDMTPTERMRLDASGNLGLGVIPSTSWFSGAAALQFGARGGLASSSTYTGLTHNLIATSGGYAVQYMLSAAAAAYLQGAGTHEWYSAPSGTAGNVATLVQRMFLSAAGNLGIGVTPSAFATVNAVQVSNGSLFATTSAAHVGSNVFFDGSYKYIGSDFASRYQQFQGVHSWHTAASGTAGNAITFTQAMTLDASGRLLIGTTSSYDFNGQANLVVTGTSGNATATIASTGIGYLAFADGTTGNDRFAGVVQYDHSTNALSLGTSASTRWQINSSGHLLALADNTYDIGASGATRPRDLFLGRNVVAAGQGNFGNLVLGTISASLSNVSTGMVGYADSHPSFGNGTLVLQARSSVARPIVFVTGATTGTARMSVKEDGQVRYVPLASAPTTNVEDGDVYYDSGTNKLRVRAGGAWVDLH